MDTAAATLSHADTSAALRRFLNCYWLRPENAFWMVLRSRVLGRAEWPAPCADLSCGDGIFSFLHAGGEFDDCFDVFTSVGHLNKVHDECADMFDHVDEMYAPLVTRRPPTSLAVGTDVKQSMLEKAAALDFYNTLLLHDNNETLPFEDASFATIHCNSAYWIGRIDRFLGEMRRTLRPDGRALLSVKLSSLERYTLKRFGGRLGDRWLAIIDRGRFRSWPSVGSPDTWARRFEAAGFSVESATPFITRTHAHIWDVGLRPIAPLLIKMSNSLSAENRREIKAEWVELFCELLAPLCDPDFDLFNEASEPAEILYVLRPR